MPPLHAVKATEMLLVAIREDEMEGGTVLTRDSVHILPSSSPRMASGPRKARPRAGRFTATARPQKVAKRKRAVATPSRPSWARKASGKVRVKKVRRPPDSP